MEERKKAVKRKSSARGGVRPKAQAGNLFKGLKNTVAQIEFVLLSNIVRPILHVLIIYIISCSNLRTRQV